MESSQVDLGIALENPTSRKTSSANSAADFQFNDFPASRRRNFKPKVDSFLRVKPKVDSSSVL